MNHLAHLFLGQAKSDWLIGNFIADHVKGKKIEDFTSGIQEGIRMHRAIDEYTDTHPEVLRSKKRLYPKYHKYAAVIIDVFFDHILAKNWKDYSPISLSSFTQSSYRILETHKDHLPNRSQRMLYYMKKDDWLGNYASIEGIGWALSGLSKRAKFESKMEESVHDLADDYDFYLDVFECFFPDLNKYVLLNYPLLD